MHFYAWSSKAWLMQNFSILAIAQMDLDKFLRFFQKKNQKFSGKLLNEFQKFPILSMHFYDWTSKARSCKISAF
jgi:hypothetical protein